MKKTDILKKNKDGSFTLTIKITPSQLEKQKQKNLKIFASTLKAEGFRKGQVPLEVAKARIDESQLTSQSLQDILSRLYSQLLEKHSLKPIFDPQLKTLPPQDQKDQNLYFEIKSCERPTLTLKTYRQKIKTINTKFKKRASKSKNSDNQTRKIIDTLVSLSTITLSPFLIEEETNRRLSELNNQLQKANISLDNYFKSQKSSLKDFRLEFEKQLKKEWTIALALEKVADDLKVTISPKEIEANIPQDKKESANRLLLLQVLRQRKTISQLQNL
jgi:FKBP-type peptidyl-prolyl cis-trans isomerase (trigger factor)